MGTERGTLTGHKLRLWRCVTVFGVCVAIFTGRILSGGPVGVVISMPLTGFIADSASGWPMAFYLYGVIGLVWSALWMVLGANSPADSRMISDNEQQYIVQNTEGIAIGKKKVSHSLQKPDDFNNLG